MKYLLIDIDFDGATNGNQLFEATNFEQAEKKAYQMSIDQHHMKAPDEKPLGFIVLEVETGKTDTTFFEHGQEALLAL